MPVDFTNTNLVWGSILVETLVRLGLTTAVVCPGSRSAPLAIAIARHPHLEALTALDERSGGFLALGLARQQQRPVAVICTSGTAGANLYPAVIEAREGRVPLLVLTADRPPELRHCNAGQAIDQQKLFGHFPGWQTELALPALDANLLAYLRQTLCHAWAAATYPVPGPVHLNCPFRDPLAPLPEPRAQSLSLTFDAQTFFAAIAPTRPISLTGLPAVPWQTWLEAPNGLIIAGPAQPQSPPDYCRAVAHLSQALGYPVLAEGLSPLRNAAPRNPGLITTYDLILRNADLATKLVPDVVLRLGEMPTSKQLRTWLATTQPRQWVIDPSGRNLDPLHGPTTHLPIAVEPLAQSLTLDAPPSDAPGSPYWQAWQQAETQVRAALDRELAATSDLFEGKVAWLLSQTLPPGTPVMISNSTPVRDVEFFWQPGDRHLRPYFNRGANGIDGILSTAIGIAHQNQPTVLLTGDLALLHDTNGWLLCPQLQGHLTVVLINNGGGGIFEMLPIAQFDPPFEPFFATPQTVDFAQLCAAYGIEHHRIHAWDDLVTHLHALLTTGVRVLEIPTDRKADAHWRQNRLGTFAAAVRISC